MGTKNVIMSLEFLGPQMTQFNPLHWKRSRLVTALALVVAAAVAGAMIGYNHAWNIISAEHLDPADPYTPIIYEKFAAAWAVGLSAIAALTIYLFEIMRGRRDFHVSAIDSAGCPFPTPSKASKEAGCQGPKWR